MSVTWKGVPEFKRKMTELRVGTPRQIGRALYEEGQHIMTRSKAEFVPVDQGILRASGQVELPKTEPGRVSVTLGYGGGAAAHALGQHESTDHHHTGGQAKKPQTPLKQ